jgi:hypothetical protein
MDQRNTLLAATALLVLFAAGIVLALSWAVAFPGVILATAWLVAFLAMAVVIGSAFREARSTGVGFPAAIGRSVKALGHFALWFF